MQQTHDPGSQPSIPLLLLLLLLPNSFHIPYAFSVIFLRVGGGDGNVPFMAECSTTTSHFYHLMYLSSSHSPLQKEVPLISVGNSSTGINSYLEGNLMSVSPYNKLPFDFFSLFDLYVCFIALFIYPW